MVQKETIDITFRLHDLKSWCPAGLQTAFETTSLGKEQARSANGAGATRAPKKKWQLFLQTEVASNVAALSSTQQKKSRSYLLTRHLPQNTNPFTPPHLDACISDIRLPPYDIKSRMLTLYPAVETVS